MPKNKISKDDMYKIPFITEDLASFRYKFFVYLKDFNETNERFEKIHTRNETIKMKDPATTIWVNVNTPCDLFKLDIRIDANLFKEIIV